MKKYTKESRINSNTAPLQRHILFVSIRQNGVGASKTSADAILPNGHTALTHVLDSSDQSHSATVTIQSAAGINRN